MDWDVAQIHWMQFKGKVRARWSKLGDHHLEIISGSRPQLVLTLQELYGLSKNEALEQVRIFEKANQFNLTKWENVSQLA